MTGGEDITPQAQEAAKTEEQKAEDIAYTVNHAISCATTDILFQPYASAWLETKSQRGELPGWLNWIKRLFESHDHHDHGHDHHGHEHHAHPPIGAAHAPGFWHNAKHWFTGEIIGDVGGIIPTIAVQRFFPGFMHGIRRVIEPIAGSAFHKGAERDARRWAKTQGLAGDAPETKAKAQALYEYELSHLPQAVMWNVFSIPINLCSQWLMAAKGHKPTAFNLVIGKTFGTLVSNAVLIGGRALSPKTAEAWDKFNGDHIIAPVTRMLTGAAGNEKDKPKETWQERTSENETNPPAKTL